MVSIQILVGSALTLLGISSSITLESRIFGGNNARIEDHPYQASLRILGIKHICGGTIISEKHILTAAHCFSVPYRTILVHTGTAFSKKTGNIYLIDTIDIHPEWKRSKETSYKNDIAVITLRDPILFNKYQQAILLPSMNIENGEKANLTGWGLTSQTPNVLPSQLKILETSIITHTECQKNTSIKVYKEQICTFREKGFGPCNGDSGGPLTVHGEVVGIVSWVDSDNCAVGIPEFYTNVYTYREFIKSVVNKADKIDAHL